ncbi:hypothetical protein HPB48_010217 [Haemaphysalis longicornis]|uniref:Endonuclease-reverse transcriptase n=1 Tax=Haemaphysalis longicornis TaxID=44386 RepID=A0A9J6G9U2_HAELO|nr:hypothetical protein HPB48_010217 [Haemaphysalis longicornis]
MLKTIIYEIRERKDSSSAVNQQLSKTADTLTSIEKKNGRPLPNCHFLHNLSKFPTKTSRRADKKIDDLENRSGQNTLLIFGLAEENDAEQPLDEQVAKGILEDIIKVLNVAIERIHRIGKPAANKCRPVILKLIDGRDKTRIPKNCGYLKGTAFSISEDFSPRVQEIRKNLWASTLERASGVKFALKFDKIKVHGKLYQ